MRCLHKLSAGDPCGRARYKNNLCIFHLPIDEHDSASEKRFLAGLRRLIRNGDGKWDGFIFPSKVETSDLKIAFPITMGEAKIQQLSLLSCRFEETVDVERMQASDLISIAGCEFEKPVKASNSYFDEISCKANFKDATEFQSSRFSSRVQFLGRFQSVVNFNNCIFSDAVLFRGHRNINLEVSSTVVSRPSKAGVGAVGTVSAAFPASAAQKMDAALKTALASTRVYLLSVQKRLIESLRASWGRLRTRIKDNLAFLRYRVFGHLSRTDDVFRVFEADANFENVEFRIPDKVRFVGVDMRRARILGTDFRGVLFNDVLWYQPSLRRNAIFDEVAILNSQDFSHIEERKPKLEETCRNLRLTIENGKNYNLASDFYIGEMELRRKQKRLLGRHLFSLEAWYRALSRYGTSPSIALRNMTLLFVAHIFLSVCIAEQRCEIALPLIPSNSEMVELARDLEKLQGLEYSRYFANSINVLTINRSTLEGFSGPSFDLLNGIFRILLAVQTALLVLAFRSRIKRH